MEINGFIYQRHSIGIVPITDGLMNATDGRLASSSLFDRPLGLARCGHTTPSGLRLAQGKVLHSVFVIYLRIKTLGAIYVDCVNGSLYTCERLN